MNRFKLLLVVPALFLTACGTDVKKTLGLDRSAPDEFAVVERAPLVVPPNFNLVPPEPGAARPQDATADNTAKSLVLGSQSSAQKAATGSASEQLLLKKAGVAQVDPNIRKDLANPEPEAPKSTAEKLGIVSPSGSGKALNPVEEAKKLQDIKVKTTPIKEEKKKTDDAKK